MSRTPAHSAGVRRSRGGRLTARLQTHSDTAADSLRRLRSNPLNSLMTIAVIGIALLLPTLLMLGINNLSQLGGELRSVTQISAYLAEGTSDDEALQVSEDLLHDDRIESVHYISPSQAAEEFARYSGFGDVLASLPDNPLPATLQIQPAVTDPAALAELVVMLETLPGMTLVQLDLDWVQRLDAMLQLAQRVTYGMVAILALAVLFIVGNTIRLAIANRRAEILVVKLVGATDGFVARPFLYTGFWYGLLGGVFALLLVMLLMLLLGGPLDRLLGLYDSSFHLQGPGLNGAVLLLGGSAALGWLGALISVRQHLSAIQPR